MKQPIGAISHKLHVSGFITESELGVAERSIYHDFIRDVNKIHEEGKRISYCSIVRNDVHPRDPETDKELPEISYYEYALLIKYESPGGRRNGEI